MRTKKIYFDALPEIQHEPRYSVEILNNQEVAPDVIIIHLSRPENFTFLPGQYIWLVLPKRSKIPGIIDRRAYSIASSKDEKFLEILIRLTDSEYLKDVKTLKKGNFVEIIGPMGSAFVPPVNGAVLLAGGTGISPFLSILRSKSKGKFILYGFESSDRPLYGKDELLKIAESQGYVVKFFSDQITSTNLQSVSDKTDDCPIFVSGPQSFVNEAFSQLRHLGIENKRIRFEACYPIDNQINDIREIFKKSNLEESITGKHPITSLDNIFFQVAYQTSSHVMFTDKNGNILYANNAATKITGYSLQEIFGQTPRLWGGLMPPQSYNSVLWKSLKKRRSV